MYLTWLLLLLPTFRVDPACGSRAAVLPPPKQGLERLADVLGRQNAQLEAAMEELRGDLELAHEQHHKLASSIQKQQQRDRQWLREVDEKARLLLSSGGSGSSSSSSSSGGGGGEGPLWPTTSGSTQQQQRRGLSSSDASCEGPLSGPQLVVNGLCSCEGGFLVGGRNITHELDRLSTTAATSGPITPVVENRTLSSVNVSGVYTVQGFGSGNFSAYLDVDTEFDKVWLKIMGVDDLGSEYKSCASAAGSLPLTHNASWNSARLQDFMPSVTKEDLKAVRFHCSTLRHTRIVDFFTQNNWQKQSAIDGGASGNAASYWTSGYTQYSRHTANLPAATVLVGSSHNSAYTLSAEPGFFMTFPFYKQAANYYTACGYAGESGDNWGCDDYFTRTRVYDTRHHAWVEFANPDSVRVWPTN
eukprot:INCI16696.1.p1 GENE.INCI16696.1~~INCI16696.1.p1  ORF type:complete len:416 (+),score=76.58 INCI16696.1:200-1447(+)